MDERKKKKGKEGRKEGRMVRVGLCVKRDRSVIFHACAEKSPVYLSLPKFVHELMLPT